MLKVNGLQLGSPAAVFTAQQIAELDSLVGLRGTDSEDLHTTM